MKQLYQAENGKIFTDKQACEKYEKECAKISNHVIGMNSKNHIFTYGECEAKGIPFFVEAQYFYIKDQEALDYVKALDLMADDFRPNMLYYYDNSKNKYVGLMDKILELSNAKDNLEYYIEEHFKKKDN